MPIEYKSVKAITTGIEDRTVTGIFCVHGNLDDGDGWTSRGDRSHPGLFGDFTVDGRRRAVFLWQHRNMDPPVATIDGLFEVARADLPPAVLSYAPDATGGVAVKRTYLSDDPATHPGWVFSAVQAHAITEMSYAYDPTRWDFEKEDDDERFRLPIRNLYEADLYDISDVNWGMNRATSADGSKGQPLYVERQMALAAIESYIKRVEALHALRVVKEGRRFSSATVQEIEETIAELRKGNKVSESAIARLEILIAPKDDTDDGKHRETARQLYLEFQRTLARAHGVSL